MNDWGRIGERRHAISGAFVFLLLGVFALFSTVMVLLSAQLYRSTVDQSVEHNAERVLSSYVLNTVRANDTAGAVRVERIDGVDVLAFRWGTDDEAYETKIYCFEGSMRELFGAAGQAFEPGYGEVICSAQAFVPSLSGNLLEMRLTDAQGGTSTVHMALRCAPAEAGAGEETPE